MKPMMTPTQHMKFKALKSTMDKNFGNLGEVFVPVAPEQKNDIPFTVLIIGQAVGKNYNSSDLSDYDAAWDEASKTVAECCPGGVGVFWKAARRIVLGTLVKLESELPDSRYDDIVGFTNLTKIAKLDGNPTQKQISEQASLCVEQLKYEIEFMRPTAIIMMVRNFAQKEIIEPVFGADKWEFDTPAKDCVAFKYYQKIPVIWMNHPRVPGKKGYLEKSIDFSINKILSQVRA
jgi:hypothetical protein